MSDPTPRRSPDGRRTVTPPAPGADSPAEELPGHGELVLIVEDEPEFRELVELWVGRHGWRTAVATDGTGGRAPVRRGGAGARAPRPQPAGHGRLAGDRVDPRASARPRC